MEALRKKDPCFGKEAEVSTWDTLTPKVFAIRRTVPGREMVCLSNFSGDPQRAHLPSLGGEYEDLFAGERVSPSGVELAPYQYRWIVKETEG